jgi:Ca2+-binding EF-hand superfamily protein
MEKAYATQQWTAPAPAATEEWAAVYCGERGTSTSDKMVDADTVKKICDIYDWDGKGELDLFYLGDIMYAMGYNTTKKVCVGLGQTDEEGKKFAKFDDVVSKVEEALKTPDSQGTYADYVELLKLYDKNQNGTMMLAELDNILCNLGDEIPKEDVQKMFAEICDPEDEDGLFPYMSFLDRLTGKA